MWRYISFPVTIVGGVNGFDAEIEYEGKIYSYSYTKPLRQSENVYIATINFDKNKGINFVKSLPSATSSKTMWNLTTGQFYPVSTVMYSPNYWDEQDNLGNKHFLFVVNDCISDETHNGFFNEFLNNELLEHKKVFEALGNKMKVKQSNEQLSGLGFSSTQRNSVVCKVDGSKIIKIVF